MGKSFYRVRGMVRKEMGKNVGEGEGLIFMNGNCRCMKMVDMEYGGVVI